jgi:hypothetical protein
MTYRIAFPLLALAMVSGCNGRDATDALSPNLNASIREAPATASNASFPRSGALHVTKNCLEYTGLAGGFCSITSSNLQQIEAGSKVIYAVIRGATELDSDVILDLPGPGNNTAFGHCHLVFATGVGLCTFSGGTGKFTHFEASAVVSRIGLAAERNWAWDGTYSFDPQD